MQKNQKPTSPETVHCRSCGAVYSADQANCPYCGTMNIPAAEKDYMDHLEVFRSGLEQLGAEPGRAVKSHLRTLRTRLIIAAAVLILAIAAGFIVHGVKERQEAEKERAEAVWQLEYYKQMDEAYNSGDYARLNELYTAALDEHYVWNYKHWRFCDQYRIIAQAQDVLQDYNAGLCRDEDLLYFELQVLELEDKESYLTPEEYALLLELRQPALDVLTQRFGMTEEDLAAFRRSMQTNGFLKYEECETFLKERGNTP